MCFEFLNSLFSSKRSFLVYEFNKLWIIMNYSSAIGSFFLGFLCPLQRSASNFGNAAYKFMLCYSPFQHSHPQSVSQLDDILLVPYFEHKCYSRLTFKHLSMSSKDSSHLESICPYRGYILPCLERSNLY